MIWFKAFAIWYQIFSVILVLWILKYYCSRWRYFSLGEKLPGPKAWPFIGNALYFVLYKQEKFDLLGMLNNLSTNYGFVRFWLGHHLHVVVSSAEDAKIYYSSPALLDRSEYFRFLEPVFGNGLPTANGAKWKENKLLLEPILRYKSLIKAAPVLHQKTDTLVRVLEKEGDATFSIYPYISKCMCDLSFGTFTGVPMDLQEENTTIHDEMEKLGIYTIKRIVYYWQHVDFLFKLSTTGKRFYETLDKVNTFLSNSNMVYTKAFQSHDFEFLDGMELSPEIKSFILREFHDKDEEELRDFVVSTVGAALETTASTIAFALMMLGMNPNMQQKLYEEISPAAENGFNDQELKNLDFLDRVIKETLRLFTPIPVSVRKASSDIWFGDHLVPKDASVTINMFSIHRDPRYYETPNTFNPDHFLPENVSKRHPYSFVPFSMGKRKCVGGNFAYIAMRLMLAKIVYNYQIKCDWKLEDIILRFYIVVKAKNLNYPIQLIKR